MAFHVRVDDTDPSIAYDGPWFVARNTLADNGDFGAPYEETLHGVNANGSLNFAFNGTQVNALGSSTADVEDGGTNPVFECFLDGTRIPSLPYNPEPQNNWVLCSASSLPPGSHELRVVATGSQQSTFWLDQIQYTPTSAVFLGDKTIGVEETDSRLSYGSGWQGMRNFATFTQTNGSTVEFPFTGTSVTWYGFIAEDFPPTPAEASYSIDGQPETTFFLQGHQTDDDDRFNQVFFRTPSLPYGDHTIRVAHRGDATRTPLVLDYLVIAGGSPESGTTSNQPNQTNHTAHTTIISTTQITTLPAAPPEQPRPRVPVGAIIGIVLASVALLVGLVIAALLFGKRRRLRKPGPAPLEDEFPSLVDPPPPISAFPAAFTGPPLTRGIPDDIQPDMRTVTPSHQSSKGSLNPSAGYGGAATPTNLSIYDSQLTVSTPRTAHTWDHTGTESLERSASWTTQSQSQSTMRWNPKEPLPSELRAVNRDFAPEGILPSLSRNMTNPTIHEHEGPQFVRHRDSGLRIEAQSLRAVVELPPMYSA